MMDESVDINNCVISFVCGQLCSGKSVYAEALAEAIDGEHIEVGDIVRKIKQSKDRKVLQDSKQLAHQISEELLRSCLKVRPQRLVVSGVRQTQILLAFPTSTYVWIECPTQERKARYQRRNREGDDVSFEEAEQGDISLGILEVKKFILKQ